MAEDVHPSLVPGTAEYDHRRSRQTEPEQAPEPAPEPEPEPEPDIPHGMEEADDEVEPAGRRRAKKQEDEPAADDVAGEEV